MGLVDSLVGSVSWPTAILLAIVGFFAYLYILYPDRAFGTRARDDIKTLPGSLPVLGHIVVAAKNMPFRHEQMLRDTRMMGEGKPYRMTLFNPALGGMDILTVSHPGDVETVLRDPYTFIKGKLFASNLGDFLGQGIFCSDGDRWHAQRKTASHVFNVKNFRDVFAGDFLHEVDQLCGHLDTVRREGVLVDLQDLLLRCTLDSFGRLAMGSDFGCISQKPVIKDGRFSLPNVQFMECFDYVNSTVSTRTMKPFWQIEERLNGTTDKIKAAQKVMFDFADKVIAQKRAQMAKGETVGEDGKTAAGRHADMLDYFMRTENFAGGRPEEDELRDVCMNLIIAGRDTTAQTLTWVFYALAQHPQVEAKCRAEAFAVLGKTGNPTYEKLKDLKYLTATFNETLRLYANVPGNILTCTKRTTLGGSGLVCEEGDLIQYSPWVMGRLESIWGPDAEEFRPERWIDERGNLKKENTFKWPVFKAGPRICLGMNMATQEGVTFLAQILRKFHLELVGEDRPAKWGKYDSDPRKREGRYDFALTLSARDTVDFRVHAV